MEFEDLTIFADKFVKGFKKSDLSQKGMGLTDAEAAKLRREIRATGYKGMFAFYILEEAASYKKLYDKNTIELTNILTELSKGNIPEKVKSLTGIPDKTMQQLAFVKKFVIDRPTKAMETCHLLWEIQHDKLFKSDS